MSAKRTAARRHAPGQGDEVLGDGSGRVGGSPNHAAALCGARRPVELGCQWGAPVRMDRLGDAVPAEDRPVRAASRGRHFLLVYIGAVTPPIHCHGSRRPHAAFKARSAAKRAKWWAAARPSGPSDGMASRPAALPARTWLRRALICLCAGATPARLPSGRCALARRACVAAIAWAAILGKAAGVAETCAWTSGCCAALPCFLAPL